MKYALVTGKPESPSDFSNGEQMIRVKNTWLVNIGAGLAQALANLLAGAVGENWYIVSCDVGSTEYPPPRPGDLCRALWSRHL